MEQPRCGSGAGAGQKNLARWLPAHWARAVPGKAAFEFDPRDYTWKSKATGLAVSGKGPAAAMPVFQGKSKFPADPVNDPAILERER